MGKNKAELFLADNSLIMHQVKKVKTIGVEEVIVSGYPETINGTQYVADIYKNKGPLGGIHAGLLAAHNENCLILSVDTPLVPINAFQEMMQQHLQGSFCITVLSHKDGLEPLLAIYNTKVLCVINDILLSNDTSVRNVLNSAGYSEYIYHGNEEYLLNCNTPEDFRKICRIYQSQTQTHQL